MTQKNTSPRLLRVSWARAIVIALNACAALTIVWLGGTSLAADVECVDYRESFQVIGQAPVPDELLGLAIAERDGYIYVPARTGIGQDPTLLVYDVSTLGDPQLVNAIELDHLVDEITIEGDFLYGIVHLDGFLIFDLTDPTSPILRSFSPAPAPAAPVDITVQSGIVYLSSRSAGLLIWDASDPDAPTLLSTIDPGHEVWNAAVDGGRIYMVGDVEQVTEFDVSDPSNPSLVRTHEFGILWMDGIAVQGQYLFAIDQTAFYAFDLELGSVVAEREAFLYNAYDIEVDGNRAYVSNSSGGTLVFDVSQPSSTTLIGTVGAGRTQTPTSGDTAVIGNRIFMIGSDGLLEADVSYVGPPMLLSWHDHGELVRNIKGVALEDEMAYLVGFGYLTVVDMSDPNDTSVIGNLALGTALECVAVSGNVALVGSATGNLWALDVSDPTNIVVLDTLVLERVLGIALYGSHAILACNTGGVRIIDWSDPSSLVEVGSHAHPGQALSVAVEGGRSYIAASSGGTLCLDLTTPTNPSLLGSFDPGTQVLDVDVSGGLVYQVTSLHGLQLVDFTDPAQPVGLGTVDTPYSMEAVSVQGDVAVVGSLDSSWHFVDVRDPQDPNIFGRVNAWLGGYPRHVAFGEGFFVGGGNQSASVVAMPCPLPAPATAEIPQRRSMVSGFSFPNPATGGTSFRLTSPVGQVAEVDIFDVSGQHVRRMGRLHPGQDSLEWDGRSDSGAFVESGRYFCRFSLRHGEDRTIAVTILR